MKMLETTYSMALQSLHQNQREGVERWICMDACYAHNLLAIVVGLCSDDPQTVADARELAQPWVEGAL